MPLLFANAGLPMIGVQMSLMVVALIPIIFIEALILRARIALPADEAFVGASLANVASTFVGIPMTWLGLAVLEIYGTNGGEAWGTSTPLQRIAAVTLQAPWLIPYEDQLYWMIPAALLVLQIPFLAASIVVEALVLKLLCRKSPESPIWRATCLANLASYSLLFAFTGVWLFRALHSRP